MMERLFPKQLDKHFEGHRAALWLLGLLLGLKLVMSFNSIAFTAKIAGEADGFPLKSYGGDGARAVLMLFEMVAVGQLALAAAGLIAIVRYRSMTALIFLLLAAEQIGRISIGRSYAIDRSQPLPAGVYVNLALLALMLTGLALSLWSAGARPTHNEGEVQCDME